MTTPEPAPNFPLGLVVGAAFRHVINEANIEAGYDRFAALSGTAIGFEDFRAAVSEGLRRGWFREPIRLPEGALHCHWCLELTPAGRVAAGATAGRSGAAPVEL